jgi:hypothetical protein
MNDEYTLVKDITTYEYPPHMNRPGGFFGSNFFEKWIPLWQTYLGHLSDKPNVVGIEIGSLNGDMTVWASQKLVNGPGSIIYTIDIHENNYLINNIFPYANIKFINSTSYEVLRSFTHNGKTKEFLDFIYVNGSHLAIDVLSDGVLSWGLLKVGGILIFDDYEWGIHTNDETQKPKLAIDAFLQAYVGHYEIISKNWQVFLKKLERKIIYDEETK